jgi:hypothetical protein
VPDVSREPDEAARTGFVYVVAAAEGRLAVDHEIGLVLIPVRVLKALGYMDET